MKMFCLIALATWPLMVSGCAFAVRDAMLRGDKRQEKFNVCAFLLSWLVQIAFVFGAAQ